MAEESRPTINVPQVTASALASVSSAVVLSTLGVVGTIVGAALGSIVLTTGSAVYSHYLNRSQDRLNRMLKERGTDSVVRTFAPGRASTSGNAETVEQRTTEAGSPANGDETARPGPAGETQRLNQADSTGELDQADDAERLDETDADRLDETDVASQLDETAKTEEIHPAGDTQHLDVESTADGTSRMDAVPEDTPGEERGRSFWSRFPWRRAVLAAAAIFLGVMAVITVFEVATGRTLTDTVQGNTEMQSNPSIFGGTSGGESDVDLPEPEDGEAPEAPAPPPATEDPAPEDPTQPVPEQEPDPDTPQQPTDPDPQEEPTEPEPNEDPDLEPDQNAPPEDGSNPDDGVEEPGAAPE